MGNIAYKDANGATRYLKNTTSGTDLDPDVSPLETLVDGVESGLTTANTQIGSLTETAPASDTASSGLNGRLQRLAQRLTALIALLPGSLGQKTAANSLAVTIASDQTAVSVRPQQYTTISSASVSIGSTASALPSPLNGYKYCLIEVISGDIRYRLDSTAPTSSVGHKLLAGERLVLEQAAEVVNFQAIQGSTAASLFVTGEN